MRACCTTCRREDLHLIPPELLVMPPVVEKDQKHSPDFQPLRGLSGGVHLALPSMEEVTANPLLTETRIPSNVRAKWGKIFAKLCSDAVFHKDNPKFWILWAMFQQAGLCKAPRAGAKNKTFYLQQLNKWERDPVALWYELKARQAAKPRKARAIDNSPSARARRAVKAARKAWAARARAALEAAAMADATARCVLFNFC